MVVHDHRQPLHFEPSADNDDELDDDEPSPFVGHSFEERSAKRRSSAVYLAHSIRAYGPGSGRAPFRRPTESPRDDRCLAPTRPELGLGARSRGYFQ